MEPNSEEGNLLEIMDLARTLRQEHLFIQQEQAAFARLRETLADNSSDITKLAYICAQQRQNLHDLIVSRPESGPLLCCRRAHNYDNAKFIDAKKLLDYEHAIAYEELFNFLYRSPHLLAYSLACGDRLPAITPHHLSYVIHIITSALFGNSINSKDVEMILKLLRELIEIQIVPSEQPRRLLRTNASAFARLYNRLNESLFSAKIFLTAALHEPVMTVLSDSDTILDIDPQKVIQRFSLKERLRRFGDENSADYQQNVQKYHQDAISRLYELAKCFVDSLNANWSLFPSTLRWLVQTMCHLLKQAHFSDKIVNEVINDMVFTYYICPAIVNPDLCGIIDAPISEQVRYNLIQIGQIIQMLALSRQQEMEMEVKYRQIHSIFEVNVVAKLIDLLLVSQSGEDVVAILSQRSDFERSDLLCTQNELAYFVEFFRILIEQDDYEVSKEDKEKLKKILAHLPESTITQPNGNGVDAAAANDMQSKERSKQSLKSKIAKSMSFSTNSEAVGAAASFGTTPPLTNGNHRIANSTALTESVATQNSSTGSTPAVSPIRHMLQESVGSEPILIFSIYSNDGNNKLQPLTEEEVLKMNSIGQQIGNGEALLVDTADSCCNMDNIMDKSSVANVFDGIDGMSDMLRPLHVKTTRFSLSHDDASIGNSDNLEAVSEAPSNHSVTSSLELEEQDQNDNLSDMVSANVSGRGTPNISGRDTPSSQVTDGDSVQLPTPQMQKLISKARSDIEDKFCKFEIKKFEGDETVSIISDTWSTDVLASDSENVEASERVRERDRNFSTPLIPSAVVLPGDNNYDVLSGAGAARVGYHLDVSDQRSESNWSTDVLASDSEKLAEVDTDDNLSVTAKSDITDAGERSDRERNRLAADISAPIEAPVVQQRRTAAEVGFFASRAAAMSAASDTAQQGSGASTGSNASDRSQEDSAFYDAINFYDETNGAAGAADDSVSDGVNLTSAAGLHQYQLSSLARSSVRTTNQLTGEYAFQQNYKSGSGSSGNENKEVAAFLNAPRMRRQASAESSISNQSLNMEEAANENAAVAGAKLPRAHHHHHAHTHHHKGGLKKKKQQQQQQQQRTSNATADLIDFSDFGLEERTKPNSVGNKHLHIFTEDGVEHRRIPLEQRSAAVDGRRNGILALQSNSGTQRAPSLRRHQSLNYENHEILINQVVQPKRVSAMPSLKSQQQQQTQPQTDDDKLCLKTADLQLLESENDVFNANSVSNSSLLQQKPNKSTGAIPKSISFDASADKTGSGSSIRPLSQRYARLPEGMRQQANAANSSIFNKLKHGLLKHRRGQKTTRNANTAHDEFSTSSRNVSFSTNASEVSFDLPSGSVGSGNAGNAMCNGGSILGYCDITEDILAKYRRKVSTSSEATNSDSIGGGGAVNANCIGNALKPTDLLQSNGAQSNAHNQALAFNVIKKKVRTVLSKTDLHTGDFRHTTYSNASPLLTYLRIQLAQAINLRNFQQISYVSEAIRCLSTLEPNQHVQLLEDLQNDLQKRQCYLQYLMRFRQNLLLIMENIGQFQTRLRSESNTCNRYLMALCVRLFVEERQSTIDAFQEEFTKLNVSDDKIESIEEFIDNCMIELLSNGGILHGMPEWQTQEARVSLERTLLQRLYQQVMFPNEDADLSRDTVLSEHIQKLQRIIRPSHPALSIPEEYLAEAPWTFAQQLLSYISAYKTPREKLQCVIRCISSIMSLLTMSSGRLPAADDVLPVLIYVVIMANPPYLLSTVEYISCFIGEKLEGEEQFYWTLFGSVVKFIKTMDYLE